LVTFKTKALAAAAGSVRSGAVGSSLRMASIMYRSSSGGLADTLLSEQARAESGLLTAGLGRSDSLPELSLLPSALELSELISLRELDQLAGLPSLSLLFGEPHADAQPAAHAARAAAPFTDDMCVPLEMTSSKMLGRPSSFTANSAAALFAGSAAMVRPHLPVQHPAPEVPPSSQHPALRPPPMVDYSPMVRLEQAAQGFQASAAAAAGPSALPGYPGLSAVPTSAAGGAEPAFEGFSFPSLGRMPLLMDRQDTFDVLIKQVDQELAAEAQIQQYAALEFDTMDIPLAPGPDMGASMVQSPCINATAASAAAAAAAVVPAVLRAAAQPGGTGEVIKRRSVFEGHHAGLVPSGVSAVSGASACTTAVALDPTGPSFAYWVAPADPSTSSFTSSAPSTSASPFCLPSHNGIVPAADSSAMAEDGVAEAVSAAVAAAAAGGAMARGKQEVARYSRVITCKTYLKRLNITQPMAEHLLPHHDLNPPTPKAAATAEGDGEGEGEAKRPASSYEALFKEFITVVDEAGSTFKVQYEGVSCNAQKHLRLTSGWRDYIRAHAVEVGDTVVFERRGNERRVLYVTLVKAADGPVDVEPDAKKRRITRKQAVQRLS